MVLRMTLRSGTGQACAACKFQRRRCTSECLLAPFFPADQPEVFHNVHRFFGVKHIQKLLKELPPDHRLTAMKSLKFHAAMRDKNPVFGCLVEFHSLAYQIQVAEEELHAVMQQLFYYRQCNQHPETLPADQYLSHLQLGMAPPTVDHQPHYNNTNNNDNNNENAAAAVTAHASSCSNNINGDDLCNKDSNDVESLWMQHQPYSYSHNNNSMAMQSQMTTSQPISIPQESVQEFNEMYSFFDNIDDRQSYIGPKEVYESSLESSDRDTRQSDEQMAENELKNAAACFSLTSFN